MYQQPEPDFLSIFRVFGKLNPQQLLFVLSDSVYTVLEDLFANSNEGNLLI
jgi:hypothetical protein